MEVEVGRMVRQRVCDGRMERDDAGTKQQDRPEQIPVGLCLPVNTATAALYAAHDTVVTAEA